MQKGDLKEVKNIYGSNPLLSASFEICIESKKNYVKFLIEKGVDLEAKSAKENKFTYYLNKK